MIDGGSDEQQFPAGMVRAAFRDALLHGGIVEVDGCRCFRRRGERDGGDFADGNRAAALLMGFAFEDVPGGDDELGFQWLGWRWSAVREIAEDAGGGGVRRGENPLFSGEAERGTEDCGENVEVKGWFHEEGGSLSFLVDGELEKPNAVDRDGLWPTPRRQAAWTYATASPAVWSVWRHR